MRVLPSNYVAQINGPYYTTQFRALAETLAEVQYTAEEAGLDSYIDFTRPEFLWQTIGTLVFPDVDEKGIPQLEGDITYRTFLKRMIELLLQGATLQTQKEGVEALTTAVVTVLEKVAFQRDPNTAWGFPEQFEFEIDVTDFTTWTESTTGDLIEGALGTGFPASPFALVNNVNIVLRALRPAQSIYEYRHLFLDAFGDLFEDVESFDLETFYYDDFRKFCTGAKQITGTAGETLTDRFFFSDATREFRSVVPGAILEILSGPNARLTLGGLDLTLGRYRVREVLRMPVGAESTPRAYTTSPTSLSGQVTILDNGELEDLAQDWSNAVEGEILTIADGPNAGNYRLETLLGAEGGSVGFVTPGSGITDVRVSPSLLRLETIQPQTVTGQTYRVGVDRLGVRVPQIVLAEDVSAQFYL